MKYLRKKFFKSSGLFAPLFEFLSLFIQKNPNKWGFLINQSQGLEGNVRALFDYAYHHPEIKPFIVDARGNSAWIQDIYPDSKIIPFDSFSWSSIIERLECRLYIISHGHRFLGKGFLKLKNTSIVNIWHGSPLKGMGNLSEKQSKNEQKNLLQNRNHIDLFITSSETEKAQIAGCFLYDGKNIKVTGLPRNEWLSCSTETLPFDIQEQCDWLDRKLEDKRLVLYAPTWREYDRKLVGFTSSQIAELDKLLEQNNAIMGVRPHPKDRDLFKQMADGNRYIIDVSSIQMPETNILMRRADILVTDYSSMWIDFLLLNRPIIGYVFDHHRYKDQRGLMYNYEAIFPGDLCEDYESFCVALKNQLQRKELSPKQTWVRELLHKHPTTEIFENIEKEIALVNKIR